MTKESSPASQIDDAYHFPADLLEQLIDTIPLLVRSKPAVFTFFRGAGVSPDLFADLQAELRENKEALNKYLIARTILIRLNELGRVDKRDSQARLLLIQDCFLRSSHGSRGFVGCGVGTDRATAAA